MNTGRIILDLPPTEDNNRNSEGAFIHLRDGKLLFAWSRYGADGRSDWAAADIYGMISADDGESFSQPFPILTHRQNDAENVMSVSFLRMNNGDIGMFYLVKRGTDCLCMLTRSGDESKTWSTPILCTKPQGYFVVNNDRVIRLKSGRILIPAARHDLYFICDENGNRKMQDIKPGTLEFYASDDDGFTWQVLAQGITLPASPGITTGVQEPGVVELADGRLWCYIRNDSGRQYQCFSADGGSTWSQPQPSQFTAPTSPLSMKRLRDGRLLALWNPIPNYNGRPTHVNGVWTGGRTPLVYALSCDEGQVFSPPIAIETDENSGFCYVAIHETSSGILLAYCAGGPGDGINLTRLRIRKLPNL
jgi:hypothetical protein